VISSTNQRMFPAHGEAGHACGEMISRGVIEAITLRTSKHSANTSALRTRGWGCTWPQPTAVSPTSNGKKSWQQPNTGASRSRSRSRNSAEVAAMTSCLVSHYSLEFPPRCASTPGANDKGEAARAAAHPRL
jgi:hypothetical protein